LATLAVNCSEPLSGTEASCGVTDTEIGWVDPPPPLLPDEELAVPPPEQPVKKSISTHDTTANRRIVSSHYPTASGEKARIRLAQQGAGVEKNETGQTVGSKHLPSINNLIIFCSEVATVSNRAIEC
jgi:hypothetical protein